MKHINSYTIIFITLLATSISCWSHESSIPLVKGKQRLSLFWTSEVGFQADHQFNYNSDGFVTSISDSYTTTCFGFSHGGLDILYEYAFTDFFSLGADLSLPDMILRKAINQTENWRLYTAPYIRFNLPKAILDDNDINMYYVSKWFFAPLFCLPIYEPFVYGDGLINVYNSLDFSYKIITIDENRGFHAFFDITHVSTYVNELFDDPQYSIDAYSWGSDYTKNIVDAIEYEVVPGFFIFYSPGIEWEGRSWNVHFAYRAQFLHYNKYGYQFYGIRDNETTLSNFELKWSMRF